MIQLTRPTIPQVLADNQEQWKRELLDFIRPFGGYSNVPTNQKPQRDKLASKYNQVAIKTALIEMSGGKCAFCESFIEAIDFGDIEHFFPKSLYPEFTFDWDNLFLACTKCNNEKRAFDTQTHPIIHPVNDNPKDYFIYRDLLIEINPDAPDLTKGKRTIEVCNLQRIGLVQTRFPVLLQFYKNEHGLRAQIDRFNELQQNARRDKVASDILDFLDVVKNEANTKETYAGFLRYFLRKSDIINEAIVLVNTQLQLNPPFELIWN